MGGRGRLAAIAAALATLLATAAPASAADPGRWHLVRADSVPLEYFQGITHDPARHWFFIGIFTGAYRTDTALREQARSLDVIPPAIALTLGFNHIGDPTWQAAGGGRVILPLECYVPGTPNGGNTCGRGAFGILDPATLTWRAMVPLDPRDIPKAMWAETSPDGRLIWTSSGRDLLAYRTSDVNARTAAAGVPIRPVRRLQGAVPASGVTGAAFYEDRLFLAGQSPVTPHRLQVWSLDVGGGPLRPRLELSRNIAAESEGLDVIKARGGVLHWLLSPFTSAGTPPTYGPGHSELLTFAPRGARRPPALTG